ncbi:MAG: helix-turn-helix domain-containing protein [Candidatus Moranbacteria bacterium]|nr:helix-turn-helix domain-containing protein [Candidatus Moranbacteria bacterium]
MYQKELQQLGLSKKEADVYLAALELGETTAHRIAKKSGIKRATVYRIVESLKEKSLISVYHKKSITFFYAENPKAIKEKIANNLKTVDEILPGLLSLTNLTDKKPKIRYYEGIEELRELILETLKYPGKEIASWSAGKSIEIYGESFWEKEYIAVRMKRKIPIRLIYADVPMGHKHKDVEKTQLRQVRIEKSSKFIFGIQIKLFGDRFAAFISDKETIGIMIESKKTFDTLKSIFEIHWQTLEK